MADQKSDLHMPAISQAEGQGWLIHDTKDNDWCGWDGVWRHVQSEAALKAFSARIDADRKCAEFSTYHWSVTVVPAQANPMGWLAIHTATGHTYYLWEITDEPGWSIVENIHAAHRFVSEADAKAWCETRTKEGTLHWHPVPAPAKDGPGQPDDDNAPRVWEGIVSQDETELDEGCRDTPTGSRAHYWGDSECWLHGLRGRRARVTVQPLSAVPASAKDGPGEPSPYTLQRLEDTLTAERARAEKAEREAKEYRDDVQYQGREIADLRTRLRAAEAKLAGHAREASATCSTCGGALRACPTCGERYCEDNAHGPTCECEAEAAAKPEPVKERPAQGPVVGLGVRFSDDPKPHYVKRIEPDTTKRVNVTLAVGDITSPVVTGIYADTIHDEEWPATMWGWAKRVQTGYLRIVSLPPPAVGMSVLFGGVDEPWTVKRVSRGGVVLSEPHGEDVGVALSDWTPAFITILSAPPPASLDRPPVSATGWHVTDGDGNYALLPDAAEEEAYGEGKPYTFVTQAEADTWVVARRKTSQGKYASERNYRIVPAPPAEVPYCATCPVQSKCHLHTRNSPACHALRAAKDAKATTVEPSDEELFAMWTHACESYSHDYDDGRCSSNGGRRALYRAGLVAGLERAHRAAAWESGKTPSDMLVAILALTVKAKEAGNG